MPLDTIVFETPLLPTNKTKYMRAIEAGMQIDEALWQAARRIGDIKTDAPDAALPFLIWENGLEILLPWISDLRLLYDKGPAWQRIRGTPDAIVEALSWVNFAPTAIEEAAASTWWDLFQMAMPGVVDQKRLETIFSLTRLSKAAHTDIIRVYNSCWDIRAFEVDQMRLDGGGYLDDWSGVWVRPEWPKISFCRSDIKLSHVPLPVFLSSHRRDSFERSVFKYGFVVDKHTVDGPNMVDPMFSFGQRRESSFISRAGGSNFETWDPRDAGHRFGRHEEASHGQPSFESWSSSSSDDERTLTYSCLFDVAMAHERIQAMFTRSAMVDPEIGHLTNRERNWIAPAGGSNFETWDPRDTGHLFEHNSDAPHGAPSYGARSLVIQENQRSFTVASCIDSIDAHDRTQISPSVVDAQLLSSGARVREGSALAFVTNHDSGYQLGPHENAGYGSHVFSATGFNKAN
jgi:hypothetical protein